MHKRLMRYTLFMVAWLAIMLGTLGIVLPLLPTTPFFILALFCFSKSSPRFQHWLLNLPGIGDDLQRWQRDKKIDKKRKPTIYLTIVLSFFISICMLYDRLLLQLMLLLIMFVLLIYIRSIAEY